MKPRRLCLLLLTLACLASSACDGPTIGPRVETRTVVVYPGQPLQILGNATITGRRLGDDTQVEQDIGGWIIMPPEHWAAVQRALAEKGWEKADAP